MAAMTDSDDETVLIRGIWPRPRPSTTSVDLDELMAVADDKTEDAERRKAAQIEIKRRKDKAAEEKDKQPKDKEKEKKGNDPNDDVEMVNAETDH